mmetsp:Transcript_45010/g.108854  ORF Transcript_45010/g.108854 Transcript_45010/m.108854 type:complete len:107 (-) Transcript_45010:1649-1969(-)
MPCMPTSLDEKFGPRCSAQRQIDSCSSRQQQTVLPIVPVGLEACALFVFRTQDVVDLSTPPLVIHLVFVAVSVKFVMAVRGAMPKLTLAIPMAIQPAIKSAAEIMA